ncbi:MAG: thioredoxin family protein [Actinomycetota bacterium]|nr:thioredoxin family protein [Actinomycetota bacterium]
MNDRLLILAAAVAFGGLLLGAFQLYRRRTASLLDRLDVSSIGLELMTGCCAFVVFTTPACKPCKTALRVVHDAAERTPATEVRTVDAMDRADLAQRYDVRTVPTVFLITASGHIVKRWRKVPPAAEVEAALSAI